MRWSLLLMIVACSSSSSEPTPSSSAPAPVPPEAPKPPPFPHETSSLVAAEALDYLPAKLTDGVIVASSLDQLDASLLPALDTFAAATGVAPGGISRTRPVGIARVGFDGGWIAFAEVEDAKAFDASVPADRRAHRGKLGFVADSADTLKLLAAKPDAASLPRDAAWTTTVGGLQLGALVSWWDRGRATGIAVGADQLYVRAVGTAGSHRVEPTPGEARARAIVQAQNAGILGSMAFTGGPTKLSKQRDALQTEHDTNVHQLVHVRAEVIHELALAIDLSASSPVERTIATHAPVKAWLAPFVERWRGGELAANIRAAETKLAVLNKRVDAEGRARTNAMFAGLLGPSDLRYGGLRDAGNYADILGGRDAPGTGGGREASGYYSGGRGGGGGTGSIGAIGIGHAHQPTVTLGGEGDAALRSHLAGRMGRVRACYNRALERNAQLKATLSVALVANADGAVTATISGADATLASCIEVVVRGTSTAKAASATFTIELAP